MASLGHVAVGMAAARVYRDDESPRYAAMAWWSALSLLPDADVIGFAMGVEYGDPWGHRGATHSLTFALALAAAIGLAAPRLKLPRLRTWAIASVVLASHGLLDTLTDGGLGSALLWPFDLTRYFAPWRPIPVAPIGLAFLSSYGLIVSAIELVFFAPLLVFARRTRRVNPLLIPIWAAAMWLIVSRDPVRDRAIGFLVREDTQYASGFSEAAFRTIEAGQSDGEVARVLGAPLEQFWSYGPLGPAELAAADCQGVYFDGEVLAAEPGYPRCIPPGTRLGMSTAEVRRVLGPPQFLCWGYTRSPAHRTFRLREVCFSKGKVAETFRRWAPSF